MCILLSAANGVINDDDYSVIAGGVMWLFVLSFIVSVSRITHERGNGRRPNMVDMGKGWPSRSGQILVFIRIRMCKCGISFSLSLIRIFFTIYCHSPGGDAAAASPDRHFIRHIFSHRRATVQRHWLSLRSLSALVLCAKLFETVDRFLRNLSTKVVITCVLVYLSTIKPT